MTRVRIGAVGLRLDLDLVTSIDRFHARLSEAAGAALSGPEPPTLLALPEHTGLLAMLAGERGADARAALAAGADTRTALFSLAVAYGTELGVVAARYPEATAPAQLLHLAVADTVLQVLDGTAGRMARERGWWVSVGAALPAWREVPGDRRADRVRFEPVSSWVRNRNLVYGPDGLLAVQDKAYLVPRERDPDGLALTSIAVDGITTVDLPFARLGSVISKDAWMVDVNDRLEQLGAQVLVQPEAFDRWDEVDRGEVPGLGEVEDLWPPDKFQRGGWWMVQRHPSIRVNVAPVLVGRLGDLVFDGQASVSVVAPAGGSGPGLHGQPPDEGWAAVAAWPRSPAEPPVAVLTAVVELPGRHAGPGATAGDRPAPVAGPPSRPLPGEGSQLVPTLAAVDGSPVLVAVEGDGGTAQQLRWWTGTPAAGTAGAWNRRGLVDPAPPGTLPPFDRRWRPRLVVAPGGELVCLHLTFARESWDLHAVEVGGAAPGAAVRVDDAESVDGVLRERGHDAQVAVRAGGELVAVWSDLRWPWVLPQVRSATSSDGGRTWSASRRLDGGPVTVDAHDPRCGRAAGGSTGQTAPSLAVVGGRVIAAWQQRQPGAGPRTVVARRLADGGWSAPLPVGPDDGGARWRPVLAATAGEVWLVEEVEDRAAGRGLEVRRSRDAGASWTTPWPLDPSRPAGTVQARTVPVPVGRELVLVYEEHRGGRSRILARRLGPGGTVTATYRVDDAPDGADARVPAAVRCGDDLVVAWQDTRDGIDRVRTRRLPAGWTPPTS
jgi:hypothetical protein